MNFRFDEYTLKNNISDKKLFYNVFDDVNSGWDSVYNEPDGDLWDMGYDPNSVHNLYAHPVNTHQRRKPDIEEISDDGSSEYDSDGSSVCSSSTEDSDDDLMDVMREFIRLKNKKRKKVKKFKRLKRIRSRTKKGIKQEKEQQENSTMREFLKIDHKGNIKREDGEFDRRFKATHTRGQPNIKTVKDLPPDPFPFDMDFGLSSDKDDEIETKYSSLPSKSFRGHGRRLSDGKLVNGLTWYQRFLAAIDDPDPMHVFYLCIFLLGLYFGIRLGIRVGIFKERRNNKLHQDEEVENNRNTQHIFVLANPKSFE